MVLIKLKSILISILFFCITSCNQFIPQDDLLVMECVLDSYISNMKLTDDYVIHIIQSRNWEGEFSNILIQSSSKGMELYSEVAFEAKYKGLKIYLSSGVAHEKYFTVDTVLSDSLLFSSLNWKKIKKKEVSDIFPYQTHFNDFQFLGAFSLYPFLNKKPSARTDIQSRGHK
jgi:hypothetical protein